MFDQYPKIKKYTKHAVAFFLSLNFILALFLLRESRLTPKIAYFDMNVVVSALLLDVHNKNQEILKPRSMELEAKVENYKEKKNEYDRTQARSKSGTNKKRDNELKKLEEEIQKDARKLEKDYSERINKDMQERMPEIIKAAEEAYKERGYDIVIHQPISICLSPVSPKIVQTVTGSPKDDLTQDILNKLGLEEIKTKK